MTKIKKKRPGMAHFLKQLTKLFTKNANQFVIYKNSPNLL